MSDFDCDCGDCDCGDCNCDCGDCNCDCNCEDSNFCFCCCCCDNDPSGGKNCCNDVNCNFCSSWCLSEAIVDTATDIDHASGSSKNRRERAEEEIRRRQERRAEMEMEPIHEQELSPQSPSNEPVTTQPGVDPSVITLQPRGDPPSYEAATEGEMS